MLVRIDAINANKGHRQDLGDLSDLINSIEALGLMHDVLIDSENNLVCGRRRLEACKHLGWQEIGCKIVDIDALRAEQDENTCRKDFTTSERVAIAKAIEERERAKAQERMKAQQPKKGENVEAKAKKAGGENFPPPNELEESGKSRDIIAKKVGMSAPTLAKAKEIVEAAEQEPEVFADLQRKMDATGKVDPVFKELQQRKAESNQTPQPVEVKPTTWVITEHMLAFRKLFDRYFDVWETVEEKKAISQFLKQLSEEALV